MLSNSIKKLYYNTAKRKLAKKWSILNIFYKYKKRIKIFTSPSKKYYRFIHFFNKKMYNKVLQCLKSLLINSISKCKFKNIKFINFKFYKNRINKYKLQFIFINSIFVLYFFSSFVLYFFIICFLFKNYLNEQKQSFHKLLNKNFFSINVFYCLLKNYYINFLNYNKNWRYLLTSFSFDMKKPLTFYYMYNLKALLSSNNYILLLDIEELKFDNDKFYKNPIDWKKIRKLSFTYLNLNILKKNCISFFTYCIFELYMYIDNVFFNFLNLNFFDYIIDFERESSYITENREDSLIVDFLNNDSTFLSFNDFNLRIQYSIFITWFHYIVFLKKIRYNLYIRNHVYFYNNFSKKLFLLDYNNPTSSNKTKIIMNKYNKIKKEHYFGSLFISLKDFNDEYSFYQTYYHKRLSRFIEKNNSEENIFIDNFFKNFEIKFMTNYFLNKNFRISFKIFWNKFLPKFYTTDNTLNCYKLLMQVSSTYKFRQASYSYTGLHQMVKRIFVLPSEIIKYLNSRNKKITIRIFSNFFRKKFNDFYFFSDFFNFKDSLYLYKNLNLLKYKHNLSNLSFYYFNSNNFFELLNINNIPLKVLSDFNLYNKRQVYKYNLIRRVNFDLVLYNLQMHYIEKKNKKQKFNLLDFYFLLKIYLNQWKSYRMVPDIFYSTENNKKKITILDNLNLRLFYLLWRYNIGLYSTSINNFNNYNLLYGVNILEFVKRTRVLNLLNKSNTIFKMGSYYKIIKFLPLLKNFYFQLLYEDKEYVLLFFFLLIKENKNFINNSKKCIEFKEYFLNNFIYRHYTSIMLFDSCFYNNLFSGFDLFKQNNYDKKLTPFIYRNYYLNYEDSFFFSLGIKNNFLFNKSDIII